MNLGEASLLAQIDKVGLVGAQPGGPGGGVRWGFPTLTNIQGVVLVLDRPLQPSLMIVGKARSQSESGALERLQPHLKQQTRLVRAKGDKHSSLLRTSVNYGQKSFIILGPQQLKLSLQASFVTSKPFQLCCTTVQLIGLIHNLRRKWSVVNTAPGVKNQYSSSVVPSTLNANTKRGSFV